MTSESQQPSTLHYPQDYQCCKCDTYFMPYQDPISVCPECGEPNLQPDDFRDIVEKIVNAVHLHYERFGTHAPPTYAVLSLVDHYVYYFGAVADGIAERGMPRALYIEEVIATEIGDWKEHLRELIYRFFETTDRLFGEVA